MALHAAALPLDSNLGKVISLPCPARVIDLSQGILICIGGLGMLVASDELTQKDYPAASLVKGDIFMIIGASLYGFSTLVQLILPIDSWHLFYLPDQRTRRKSISSVGHPCTRQAIPLFLVSG
jgi:hypothetical protein